ncbi:MAG: TIGR01777 family oxidoreductase [Fimbriimonadaceae bacterium]|nr:TIGR01777 family oxidoreductase [Fimbriimonadaceae bacterium]
MQRVILAGGSGFLGRRIAQRLRANGSDVRILTRRPRDASDLEWDGRTLGPWANTVANSDAVINLAGESISIPWTAENRRRILSSRLESASVISQALATAPNSIHWINASAVGFYGDRADERLSEASPAGTGFLAETCVAWENALFDTRLPTHVTRTAIRIGLVLGPGGALPVLAKLAQFGLGGSHGSGRQWMPWISVEDIAGGVHHVLSQRLAGPVNLVGPDPVPNDQFMRTLRQHYRRPWSPPAPTFALRIAGFLGAPDPDLLLQSQRVEPLRLHQSGYTFRLPALPDAIRAALA